MSMEIKGRKRNSKKQMPQQPATPTYPAKTPSLHKTKKQSNKKQLRKCKSKPTFRAGHHITQRLDKGSKSSDDPAIRRGSTYELRKDSTVFYEQSAENAYFPEQELKSDNIQQFCLLSTQSKQSTGRLLNVQKNIDSTRTLNRQDSKPVFSHEESDPYFSQILARTERILQGYMERCSYFERDNVRLKEQLLKVKKHVYKQN